MVITDERGCGRGAGAALLEGVDGRDSLEGLQCKLWVVCVHAAAQGCTSFMHHAFDVRSRERLGCDCQSIG